MTNYAKTREVIEKAGLVYNKSAEEQKEEKWFATVKNPRTGDFFQWSDLKQVGIEPFDEETGKRIYPIKIVGSIYRIQSVTDEREYLMSRQTWTGLDRIGNEVSKSMEDLETWIKPIPDVRNVKVEPNDKFSRMEPKVVGIKGEKKVYEKPFTPEDLDEIYLLPATQELNGGKKSLIIMKVDENGQPLSGVPKYEIAKYEDFRNRPFDELFEWASTPRQPSQTKMGIEEDNEKNKQYG